MKHTVTFATLLLLASVTILTSSCKKEYTQVVNQVYSVTYTVKPTDWVPSSSGGLNTYSVSLNVPEVDQIVVANGGVQLYLSFDNGASFEAIPDIYNGYAFNMSYSVGQVGIVYHDESSNNLTLPSNSNILAKVVILDGAPLTP